MADIYIGNVKGPQGETGATGAQGPQGDAATISVGTVSTTEYGNTAQVTNTGTSSAAVFDFVIPQGRPGEETTQMSALTLDTVTAQSAEFPIPATGESGATVFGKIIKFFNDAKTAINSKINISDIVNNLTSTATNKPLSAAQGKALNDALVNTANTYVSIGNFTHTGESQNYTDNNYRFLYFELLADTSSPNRIHATKLIPMSLVRARPSTMEFVFDATRATSSGTFASGCIMIVSKTSVGIVNPFSNGWTFNTVRVYGIK